MCLIVVFEQTNLTKRQNVFTENKHHLTLVVLSADEDTISEDSNISLRSLEVVLDA